MVATRADAAAARAKAATERLKTASVVPALRARHAAVAAEVVEAQQAAAADLVAATTAVASRAALGRLRACRPLLPRMRWLSATPPTRLLPTRTAPPRTAPAFASGRAALGIWGPSMTPAMPCGCSAACGR